MLSSMMRCLSRLLPLALLPVWSVAQMAPENEISRECIYGDCQNGFGTLEIHTELGTDRYEGNFTDGIFDGYGKYEKMVTRSDRAYYDGSWNMGVREGRGTYWDGKSDLYIGQWQDDMRHGRGSYFFGLENWYPNKHSEHWLRENVENYSGEFVEDLYQGEGTYRWPNGQRFEGEFFANEKHGLGVFYYPTGTWREQLWEYGRLIR